MRCAQRCLRAYEVEKHQVPLPDFHELRDYQGEYVLVGVGLTETRYHEIRKSLPPHVIDRLIGWKRISL